MSAVKTSMDGAHRAMNDARTVVNETLQAFVEEIDSAAAERDRLRTEVDRLTAENASLREQLAEIIARKDRDEPLWQRMEDLDGNLLAQHDRISAIAASPQATRSTGMQPGQRCTRRFDHEPVASHSFHPNAAEAWNNADNAFQRCPYIEPGGTR